MKKLYLDDCRTPADPSWIVVRSYDEFVDWITKNGMPDFISFDHDLVVVFPDVPREEFLKRPMVEMETGYWREGTVELPTGKDCAIWLVYHGLVPKEFSVHSANPEGGDRILRLLNNWQECNAIKSNGYKTFWELKIDEDEIQ